MNPRTIAAGNTVPSTQVADARIEYRRNGYIDEAQTMGWLQRFFLNVLPLLSMRPRHHLILRRDPAARALLALPRRRAGRALKDLASIQGVRHNQLIGYGLVVGLDGSGDQTTQTPFTMQSLTTMLQQLGVNLPPARRSLQLKNVAAVMVTATLPAFAQPGQTIDVTVSSMGNAKSLRGGTLLMTPLKGADGADLRHGAGQRAGRRRRAPRPAAARCRSTSSAPAASRAARRSSARSHGAGRRATACSRWSCNQSDFGTASAWSRRSTGSFGPGTAAGAWTAA